MPEGFIGRWSRLKKSQDLSEEPSQAPSQEQSQAHSETLIEDEGTAESLSPKSMAETEAVDTEAVDKEREEAETTALEPGEELSDAPPVLTDIDMPDLSTINSTSDMSMFFSGGVSAELRRKALRTFFHQPEFNFRDPLDDYALDYSQPTKLVLKVGDTVRGWAQQQMDDAMQQARDALLNVEPASEAPAEESLESDIENIEADSTNVDEADQRGKNEAV